MADHIDDEDVIAEAIAEAMGRLHTILPATLTSYDHETQRGSITFDLRTLWVDAETDTERWIQPTGVQNVPVIMHPAVVADLDLPARGLALIAERDIDGWKVTGGQGIQPADPAKFQRNDALFLPGVYPAGGHPDARPGATVLPSQNIRLGDPDATAPVAREPETASALRAANQRIAALEAKVDALATAQSVTLQPLLAVAFPALGATTPATEILRLLGVAAAQLEPPVTGLGSSTTKVK